MMNKDRIYEERTCSNFRELIAASTRDFGTNTAFSIKDKDKKIHDISFIDFDNNIKELGSALLDLGLENKKIAIISPDRYEWCCSYFAISTANCIVVPLDYLLPHVELTRLIIESQVDAVIFDSRYLDLMSEISKNKESAVKFFICMDDNDYNIFEGSDNSVKPLNNKINNLLYYSDLLKKGHNLLDAKNSKYDSIKINNDELSILIYTSGTTSKPKAVMLSQYNICSNVSAMTTLIKHQDNDSILVFLPLHHTLACTASFLFCYYTGFRICFADSIKDIAKNLVEYKISGLVCVPAVLDIMYRQIIRGVKKSGKYVPFKILCGISNFLMFFHIDLRRKFFKEILDNFGGNMRTIIYGSASSDKKTIHLLNTIGIVMIQGYGLTETAPVISCESDKYHSESGSSGFPLYNEEVKIDNPDETGTGEILVKGPNVMLGYYNNPEATKNAFKDGWFCTGDLGRFGKDGSLFVTGRKKDLIVLSNGKKVFPEELEALLNKLDLVEESMIYEKNDRICAKIVYSKDNPLVKDMTEDQIHDSIEKSIKDINKNLPIYKYIREFILSDEPLIKTTTQKIKRHEEMAKINND